MIVLGVILFVIGAVLWVVGALGHAVGGRKHYWYQPTSPQGTPQAAEVVPAPPGEGLGEHKGVHLRRLISGRRRAPSRTT